MRRWVGEGYAYAESGTTDNTYPWREGVWAATFGETVLLSADPGTLEEVAADVPDGMGRWQLNIHSVVDLCQFSVTDGMFGDRHVVLYPENEANLAESCAGSPLPFEEPFWAGEHDDRHADDREHDEDGGDADVYPLPFSPLSLGESAVLWMFGLTGEGAERDAVTAPLIERADPFWAPPMHRFAVGASEAVEPAAPEPSVEKPRKRSLRRWLRG